MEFNNSYFFVNRKKYSEPNDLTQNPASENVSLNTNASKRTRPITPER
jgi:hypothetical protein